MNFEFSKHAIDQIEHRFISKEMVLSVVLHPDSIVDQDETTRIYSKLVDEDSKFYLYRVFVNYLKDPLVIITAYRTSKIKRYGY
ncbi:MAG TPA: hypothetical protein DCL77_19745 [Prolixibacteraceae bacterium]|jgi:hypothetical protein|nr:hypothetical protein [Prolixibacteraceae bacterium]